MIAVLPAPTFLLLLLLWFAPAQAQTLRYLGQQVVPHGHVFRGTEVGGLSGLDYDKDHDRFVAISDDRSQRDPARIYVLKLDLAKFGPELRPGHAGIEFIDMRYLRDAAGRLYEARSVDPEAIRLGREPGGYWWASEGDAKRGIPPAITEVGAGGTAWRELAVPAAFLPGNRRGVRDNLAFESLAIDAAAGRLYVGVENALQQDGPEADVGQGSPSRLLVYDLQSGERIAEHVYKVDRAYPVVTDTRYRWYVEHRYQTGAAVAIDVLERDDLPFPQSLPEFQRLFPDEAACAAYLERAR